MTSEPPGALVRLDGEESGRTPAKIPRLRPGSYVVRLEMDDYKPIDATAEVTAKGAESIHIALEMMDSSFSIDSVPAGATVLIDGKESGVTPLKIDLVPAGLHEVRLRLVGYAEQSEEIDLPPGGRAEKRVELKIDPRRAEILKAVEEAETHLQEGRSYLAWRALGGVDGMPGRTETLTKEDEGKIGYLNGQIQGALPDVRFHLSFEGQGGPVGCDLGPPTRAASIPVGKGEDLIDYEIEVESKGEAVRHLCLLQIKRKGGSVVRVVPHEMLSKAPSLPIGPGSEDGRTCKVKDSTRARVDDVLYCLIVSGAALPEKACEGLMEAARCEDQGEDPLSWAREVARGIEAMEWFREAGAVLRSALVCMEDA